MQQHEPLFVEGQVSQRRYGFTDEKKKQGTRNVSTSKPSELDELRAQIQNLQLEVDILKEMLDVLKKDPGTDWKTLKNREKAVMIGAMKKDDPLPLLLRKKESLGFMCPAKCRASLGIAA